MATILDSRPSQQSDAYLESQLFRARRQVRQTDLANGILRLVCLTAGFAIITMVIDRAVELPAYVRQIAFGGWLVTAGVLAFRYVARPMLSMVNPYYTARQVERTIPDAKNSLVNWLDLRDKPLAPVIHNAVSLKAAEHLREADVDEAVRDRGLTVWSIVTGLLLVAAIALILIFRPAQFFSLLNRTFAPFSRTAIAQQTTISILEPVGGDMTVPIHQSVDVRVAIAGRVPRADEVDAARIKIRYNSDDPEWEERKLEAVDRTSEWSIRIPSADVRNGFEYQVVAGDGATPIHRIATRAKALVTDFEVRYHYRPYLNFTDDVRTDPNLQALRGTEVTLIVRTNRVVKAGVLKLLHHGETAAMNSDAAISGERPDSMRFQLTLVKDGQYRLQFVSADGERSDETLPYDIRVVPDNPPDVKITQETPEKLPVNGTLFVGAHATDDLGLSNVRLQIRLKTTPDGFAEALPTKHHRAGQPWKLPDGQWPRSEHMKEVVALESLQDLAGRPIVLRAGMQIVYQFEAEDNCDMPKPQLGQSREVVVTLTEPQAPEQRDAEREQAQNQKQQHDQQQEQERKDQAPPNEKNQQQSGDGQPKDGDKSDAPMNPQDQKTIDQAKRLADALNKKDQAQPPQDGQPNEQKQNPNEQPKGGNDQSKSQPKENPEQKGQPGDPAQPKADANNPDQKSNPDDGGNKAGEQKGKTQPDQVKNDNQQKANPKADGSDPKEANAHQMKPGEKTGARPDSKSGDPSEKTGEKTGAGNKQDKSSDSSLQKSPDQSKADQGQAGSKRSDANPNGDQKTEKPTDTAKSGKSDPQAPKPDEKETNGASDAGNPAPKSDSKSKPDSGNADAKPTPGQADSGKGKMEDAPRPHEKAGEKPTEQPKTDGAKSESKSNDNKQNSDAPKPEDVKKLLDEFKKADPETQKKIIDKLKEMAKSAPTPKERQAADEAAKDCQGQCDNPGNSSKPGDKSANGKAGEKSGGKADGAKPGDKGSPKAGEKSGDDPGNKSSNQAGKPGDQAGEKTDQKSSAIKSGEKEGPPQPGADGKAQMQKPGEKSGEGKGQAKQAGQQGKSDQPGEKNESAKSKGNNPGLPDGARSGDGDPNTTTNSEPGPAPNEKFLRESGDLQLDQFKKKVDRKLLEELKMTDEEYQEFLRAYQDLLKRSKDAPKPDANDKVRGAARGGSSANSQAKKVEAGPKTGPKTERGGRGAAPPEFRDQYREFTEEQSKQSKAGKP